MSLSVPSTSSATALCILTRYYNEYFIDLLNKFTHFDVFLVIDDNTTKYPPLSGNVHIVQVDEADCKKNNYYKSSTWANLKEIISWDKALYYFNHVRTEYEHVWFLEDDVFFYNEDAIWNIHNTYPTSDLLSAFHEVNPCGDIHAGWNHWINVIHRIGTPWAHSLVCVCRLSRRLLDRVDRYLDDRHLIFIEALFNTLALHNKYQIDNPPEFSTITYDKVWNEENVTNPTYLYHPVKKQEAQVAYRNKLLEMQTK